MKLRLFFVLLLTSFSAYAAGPAGVTPYHYSEDSYRKLYLELQYLYGVGVEIHKKYDFSERQQVGMCKAEYGYNTDRAETTIGIANRLGGPHKDEMVSIAWDVYWCSKCGSKPSTCKKVPAGLEKVKKYALEELKQQRESGADE